jgi:UvrB/UvrC motif-containing protein
MSKDVAGIVEGWDFDPERISVRIVQGDDGQQKIQLRIDMGLMQMEMDGRPDGATPHGFETLLDYYDHAAEEFAKKYGDAEEFRLDGEDCAKLMREGIQFYHRYLALFQCERYDLVVRDTDRNLHLFEFVCRFAESEDDRWQFDQYRPYVAMMSTRAKASMALEGKDFHEALNILDQGISLIWEFLDEYEQTEHAEDCGELQFLEAWRNEIAQSRPLEKVEKLEQALADAVRGEQYERAAEIRDEIGRMQDHEKRDAILPDFPPPGMN